MTDDNVRLFKGDDPNMLQAYDAARRSFKYLWRELSWERRRIVPALDMACVKAPFFDPSPDDSRPEAEHMWLDEIEFDGLVVSGVLLNQPNWVTSVSEGDQVSVPLSEISDWMYACLGKVCGGYTINVLRSKMDAAERAQHDEAWGFDFGDPYNIKLVPGDEAPDHEHPMSVNSRESFEEFVRENPEELSSVDEKGFTFLHHQVLAGSFDTVEVLLAAGADPNGVAHNGQTPMSLAKTMRWSRILDVLKAAGAE